MATNKAKATIYLDKSHKKNNGESTIYIRVAYNRIRRYYATFFRIPKIEGVKYYSLTNEDFEKVVSSKPGKKFSDIADQLQETRIRAQKIIDSLSVFSFEAFDKKYNSDRTGNDTIEKVFYEKINKLIEGGRIGYAESFRCAKNSLVEFKPNATFIDVTIDFLTAYEKWMLQKGRTRATIGFYVRNLRTMYNSEVNRGYAKNDQYPFGKERYKIPKGKNEKKALPIEDIGLIYNYKAKPNSTKERAQQYFIFSYLLNGANCKDIAQLKFENIKGKFIEFVRAKTINTVEEPKPIKVPLTKEIEAVINKIGNSDRNPHNYIFPILTADLTPTRQRQFILQQIAVINDYLKIITTDLKISQHVTLMTARHSFATIQQQSGASTAQISEALGHRSQTTTANYLAGFRDETKIEMAKNLLKFKKTNGKSATKK